MKLLFVINQFYKGGAETTLLNLLKSLDPKEYQVDLLVYDQLKLKNVVSLLPFVPDWIQVCDAAERETQIAFVKKACHKVIRDLTNRQMYRRACYDFVRGKHYDAAISYGEWFSPEFVATAVEADRKIVWIHSDIDKAQFFNETRMFQYDAAINLYLFVSQRSMEGAVKCYPRIQGRTAIVHNICDDQAIRKAAQEDLAEGTQWKRPVLLTVANFRAEKNHLRQVEAMRILKRRGFDFTWVNIGSDTDVQLIGKIDSAVKKYGLTGRFIRMSAEVSPYKYMRAADAVAVLSDFESWSLVITEAKLIGIPVIATRTSGALEQIVEGETGVLCDFTAESIADKIEKLLGDARLRSRIRENLRGFTTQSMVLEEFAAALNDCRCHARPKLLYVSDNINYISGVQRVTATQVKALREDFDISIFSMEPADERSRKLFAGVPIYDMQSCCAISSLTIPTREVIFGGEYTLRQKLIRLFYACACHLGMGEKALQKLSGHRHSDFMEQYDTVCVLSEASQMRATVAKLVHPKKVQWIHTDYALWSQYTDWTKMITRNDGELYKSYDRIVCLTQTSRAGFVRIHPHLEQKTTVIPNIQPVEEIVERSKEPLNVLGFDPDTLNIVTVGRMDTEKAVDRILRICQRLKKDGYAFHWYFAGAGVLLNEMIEMRDRLKLNEHVIFLGNSENPYPLMAHADVFALLSHYEGLPVTIDEAKILHTPVIATKVGGIVEQVTDGKNGMLLRDDEEAIYDGLKLLVDSPQWAKQCRLAMENDPIDQRETVGKLVKLFK